MKPPGPDHRYVFIAGLHRTGTSLLAWLVASHPAVAAIGIPCPRTRAPTCRARFPTPPGTGYRANMRPTRPST